MSQQADSPVTPASLAGSDWLRAPEAQAVMAAVRAGGYEIRAVGGAVRNALLGLPVKDVDMATPARPEEVMRLARAAGLGAAPTGIDHGTVTVIANHVPFEVTTLRRDVETHGRHATVAFTDNWAADAARRDFTVNALYCDAAGTVFDPLGGFEDLAERRIRFIGDARQRIREDYLRILRFFRFTAEYAHGPMDREGLRAAVAERDGLTRLSAERIRQELVRLILAPGALAAVGDLIAYGFLPGLLGAAPRPAILSRLVAIEAAHGVPANAMLRLAALAVETQEDADQLARRLRLSGDERAGLSRAVRAGFATTAAAEPVQRERLYRLGAPAYRAVTAIDLARALGADLADPAWRSALALPERWLPPTFPLKGTDVVQAGVAPGPRVGAILRAIEAWWIATGFSASPDACRERLVAEIGLPTGSA